MKKSYGNHSCKDCTIKRCPISNYSNRPNECSYYWPSSSNTKPGLNYYVSLNKIAKERDTSEY